MSVVRENYGHRERGNVPTTVRDGRVTGLLKALRFLDREDGVPLLEPRSSQDLEARISKRTKLRQELVRILGLRKKTE